MKQSKNIIIRSIQNFSNKFFNDEIYSYVLFARCFNKFKRSINRNKTSTMYTDNLDNINSYEYKISSQNNEDGIIEHIFNLIPNNKNFIEIGIGYYEFNTLNLIKNNWTGVLLERDSEECLVTKKLIRFFYPKSNVAVVRKDINRDNINDIINNNKKSEEIDFFSLDIDSNDYWVLKNIDLNKIKCVCLEYNHWIGANVKKTIPYDENFKYEDNGYFGASLLAFNDLMEKKQFKLIAIESSGTNAFFVQNKYSHLFETLDPIKSFKSTGRLYPESKKKEIFSKINDYNFTDI